MLQWDRIWGSTELDRSNAIALDSSENIYIIGETWGFGAKDSDMCLIKYNNSGDLEWYRIWGESGLEYGNTITVDSLDNIYVAGGYSDIALVKYDSTGVEQWNRTLSDADCYGIALDSSENIYLAGNAWNGGNKEIYLVKYSNSGIIDWDLSWGGSDMEECEAIRLDSSGNIYLAGRTWSYGAGMGDLCLVKFSIDIIAPFITINSPLPNQLCGVTAPTFNIQITEPNLQLKLYSLNGRPNITFTTQTQFSQTEWNQVGNGTVSITFYAIDKAGNANSSEVIVRKDAYVPDITIYSPLDDDKFGKIAPNFSISIIEEVGDLVSTWYTLEYFPFTDIDTFPLTELNGTIDQDWWDDAPKGEIRITFYAEDRAGNIGSEIVYIHKSLPSEPAIPGYNLFFLFGILSVAVILISKKLKKS